MNFYNTLNKHRRNVSADLNNQKGFIKLMQAFLAADLKYSGFIEKVWMLDEFSSKIDLKDAVGIIDMVAMTMDGNYWAISSKCYQETDQIEDSILMKFFDASKLKFKDKSGKSINFHGTIFISTTNGWPSEAESALEKQNSIATVVRINLYDLDLASLDWEKLDKGSKAEEVRETKRDLMDHQKVAQEKALNYFSKSDRGKLIMACGTGKTFTSLRIAEKQTKDKGLILFLVPSIALLGQTLREWTTYANKPINTICICSDAQVSKKKGNNDDNEDISGIDLGLPASTDTKDIIRQFESFHYKTGRGMTVVFSTYQSIGVIAEAQKALRKKKGEAADFDLIICDEAHRTTGVSLAGQDESAFTKVHDNKFLKAKKRLYMTATPKLYSDDAKSKAALNDAEISSMDDKKLYGDEIFRIGFGEAVALGLLTDYKVLVLTLSESDVPPSIQKMIANRGDDLNADDASKLIGCLNALSKQIIGDEGLINETDGVPMKRALAFCPTIAQSKKITANYNKTSDIYIDSLPEDKRNEMVSVHADHIDGSMSAPKRDELLGWLKSEPKKNECHILTNVRCLSEGVDVPSLDAVLFLSAKNSQVDVVQSVGRVMRKSPGKKYGYIIIPVVVPSNLEAEKALENSENFKVVWTVLNALRAHDDRFNATINKIELNKHKPTQIVVAKPGVSFENGKPVINTKGSTKKFTNQMTMHFEDLQHAVFARMVKKVGDPNYWEKWAKSIAEIAERNVSRLNGLIKDKGKHQAAFEKFLDGLQANINPSITHQQAVEMLSQHIITKPVFDALFEGYSFVQSNPVSVSMQTMLDILEEQALEKDLEVLEKFYASVKVRAAGLDNAKAKQDVIKELYDKFFKTAFPKMVEKLGIVYTPVVVIDFIIHSVNDILKKEFNQTLSDENVNILDPFTGTGTFMTRLLQSGLINKKDLTRKYKKELYANEIVLLAYYIAAVNIENAYHEASGETAYTSFDGICLTDTFQLGETDESEKLFAEMFPQNIERVERQKKAPLKVIIGNPPYSVGQKSANDLAQNQKYSKLDQRITKTYVESSSAGLNKSTYDSFKRAFRWSTDRLDKDGGILCFVSNGSWIDDNSSDGFRKSLEKEFTSIYVFNLRGNANLQGEVRKKEGGNVFDSGSRTPIAITLLVSNPKVKTEKATIFYHDIGDYLSQVEKIDIIDKFQSVSNKQMDWKILSPNEHGDWITQRSTKFQNYIPLEPEKKLDLNATSIFTVNGPGVSTGRDPWIYNFNNSLLKKNIKNLLDFYNDQQIKYSSAKKRKLKINIDDVIDTNTKSISWTANLKKDIERGKVHQFNKAAALTAYYRPFCKLYFYNDKSLLERSGISQNIFPTSETDNLVIALSCTSSQKGLSLLMVNSFADYHLTGDTQCFPLYYFENKRDKAKDLFDLEEEPKQIRQDGISDFILNKARLLYNDKIKKEDIFYYVYGFLHSNDYRDTFGGDLKKMLPRIFLVQDVKDFLAFVKAGRKLADLHLNYESVAAFKGVKVSGEESKLFKIEKKLNFIKKDKKDTIIYNSKITISNIPDKAYEYIVNGKSAIEWILDRYQVTVDLNGKGEGSGIKNDPNDWATEGGNPRYILDLLLSVINVSVQTVDIVNSLPKLNFETVE